VYVTTGVVDVFTVPECACHSAVSWPSPLYPRRTWFTTDPPLAAS